MDVWWFLFQILSIFVQPVALLWCLLNELAEGFLGTHLPESLDETKEEDVIEDKFISEDLIASLTEES